MLVVCCYSTRPMDTVVDFLLIPSHCATKPVNGILPLLEDENLSESVFGINDVQVFHVYPSKNSLISSAVRLGNRDSSAGLTY